VAYSRARKQNHELEEVLREKAENETGNKWSTEGSDLTKELRLNSM
jgi:hypothetical protein